jgi:hypothetical protein
MSVLGDGMFRDTGMTPELNETNEGVFLHMRCSEWYDDVLADQSAPTESFVKNVGPKQLTDLPYVRSGWPRLTKSSIAIYWPHRFFFLEGKICKVATSA